MKERCYTIDDGGGEPAGILGRANVLDHVASILDDDFILADGGKVVITIQRNDMAREEYEALPDI